MGGRGHSWPADKIAGVVDHVLGWAGYAPVTPAELDGFIRGSLTHEARRDDSGAFVGVRPLAPRRDEAALTAMADALLDRPPLLSSPDPERRFHDHQRTGSPAAR